MSTSRVVRHYENGRFLEPELATVPSESRAVLYGESVFETMRVYDGRIFEIESHLKRLARGASLLGMEVALTEGELAAEVRASLAESGLEEAAIRLTLVRDGAGRGLSWKGKSATIRLMTIAPLSPLPRATYESGLRATTELVERHSSFSALPAKLGSYLPNILALAAAERKGAEEALLLATDGFLLGGSTSNVFVVVGGELWTPPLGGGILPGVTRAVVLRLAAKLGLTLHEKWLTPSALEEATEIFLTSSLRELMPIASVDGRAIGVGGEWPVWRRLSSAFELETRRR